MKKDLEGAALKKITWRIVPFVMFTYFIAFFDRINIGFAALTMNQDLGFSSTVFGIGAGMFFIGYFFTDVPSNIILQKVGPRIWLARIMVSWGIVAAGMISVKTVTGFYILRFFLGVAEAGFFSGTILSFHDVMGLTGWQFMFLLAAVAAILLGGFTFFYLNDTLEKNTWLNQIGLGPQGLGGASSVD